jgi:hypothetical protein
MSRAARDFFTSAVSGSAGSGRVPLPRVYGDACLASQRPPRAFLFENLVLLGRLALVVRHQFPRPFGRTKKGALQFFRSLSGNSCAA